MDKDDCRYKEYIKILKDELKIAMGCTEPIALAYAAAVAAKNLGNVPDRIYVGVSGSIIKNVKSVFIPNTKGLKGIEAAVSAGIVSGNAELELEVIAFAKKEDIEKIVPFMESTKIEIDHIDKGHVFEIDLIAYHKEDYCEVKIVDTHTNIVLIKKNDNIIFEKKNSSLEEENSIDKSRLTIREIVDFADTADIEDIKPILDPQIEHNMDIAAEGMKNNYGANIGKVLYKSDGSIRSKMKGMAAAASDARMNGCEMPVVINSGSGNQGITVSVPVIVYAKENNLRDEKLYTALTVSNLVAIHQKSKIGTLSAYCGAVSAGAGSAAGIAYLDNASLDEIEHIVANSLAIVSGIVCDGAKASCAAKIATAVDAGLLSKDMYENGQNFSSGDGIVGDDVEVTIKNVGRLGRDGMRGTNDEIISIMIGK